MLTDPDMAHAMALYDDVTCIAPNAKCPRDRGQLGLGHEVASSSLPCNVAFKLSNRQRVTKVGNEQ